LRRMGERGDIIKTHAPRAQGRRNRTRGRRSCDL
jgi:hypothetical protein